MNSGDSYFWVSVHEVQQKWLNLRTCFSRDIATHRKAMLKDPVSAKKRHRYLHYKKLLFLLPPSEYAQALTPNVVEKDNEDERFEEDKNDFDDDMNGFEETEDVDSYIEEVPVEAPQTPKSRNGVKSRYSTDQSAMGAGNNYNNDDEDDDIVPIPDVSHQTENIDENVNFVLSLVPTLRSFSEEQQFDAKIEIMRVLKQFKLKR